MSDYDRRPTNVNVTPGPTVTETRTGGGLYFIVGALVVAVLVGGFLMFGGNFAANRADVARGADRKIDVTIEQPRAPAVPPAATPAPPAAPRQ